MPGVHKSYNTSDPVIAYCTKLSLKWTAAEQELHEATRQHASMPQMLGAPEVLQMGKNFIRLIHAKKVLDIGTYTGASAFAWATALPADGRVITMDVSHTNFDKVGRPIFNAYPDVSRKVDLRLGAALATLDSLIADGQEGTFDLAFIDADKGNYSNYYERCMRLLRSGGVILVDNALWSNRVVQEPKDEDTAAIDACNHRISEDARSDSMLLLHGDGTHVAFKL